MGVGTKDDSAEIRFQSLLREANVNNFGIKKKRKKKTVFVPLLLVDLIALTHLGNYGLTPKVCVSTVITAEPSRNLTKTFTIRPQESSMRSLSSMELV